jgi:hypothetical protein
LGKKLARYLPKSNLWPPKSALKRGKWLPFAPRSRLVATIPTECEENLDLGVGLVNQKVLFKSLRRRMGENQKSGEGNS